MKKLVLTAMIMSLLTFGAMNSEEPVQVKAETTITDTEYNNSFHLAQMNVSKKLMETYDGSGVTIAIIDTGVNFDHEEFKDSSGNTIFSELSCVITGSNTWKKRSDYSSESAWASALDDKVGHGTHVAGLIAAQPNGKGIVGIAPKANIIFIKAVDANNAFPNNYIQTAITYAANNGADIISMSIQSYANSVTYNGSTMTGNSLQKTAFNKYTLADYNLGCTLLAAAGNYNTSEPSYPANSTNVISVGSVSKDDKTAKAPFSNYGIDNIDVVAPGYVMSTYKGSTDTYKSDWYGTSFSTPLTAGLLALYKQANPDATNKSMTEALYASCDSITNSSTYPGWAGNGMINGDRLLNISNATAYDISAVIAKFAEKRTDPTDLSAIKTSIDEIDTFIKNNASTAPELNKYEYVTPIHNAYNFLADTWYKSVRIKTTSSTAKAVRRANNVDLSICDTVSNETKARAIVDTYNGLDSLTREILNSTYDVTGSDGVDITIGTSMKYIADASSLSIDTTENQLSLVNNTSNPLLIAVIICSAVVVVLASAIVFISLKKKKANIVE